MGIYRLVMKESSDNLRGSVVQGIMNRTKAKDIEAVSFGASCAEPFFSTQG